MKPSMGIAECCQIMRDNNSRAGFMAWVKDFYKLEKVYTKEDPKE